ncbi:MAG: hypothetical protein DRP70_15545 [Spirochaetes bacterium]|nr:MAG: hypothetical protein DRP70_15545 [Spirochaetota bacterium]
MCGGNRETFDKAEEILSVVGETAHFIGKIFVDNFYSCLLLF